MNRLLALRRWGGGWLCPWDLTHYWKQDTLNPSFPVVMFVFTDSEPVVSSGDVSHIRVGCFLNAGWVSSPPIPFRNVMMRVWNPGANSVPVCREGSSAPPAVLCGSESRFEIGSWSARTHLERQENSGSRFLPVCAPPAGMLCSCQTHCGACSSSSPRLSLLSLLCSGVGLWPEVP